VSQNELQQFPDGGDKRDRTADLLNAIQALSQLSYTPVYPPEGDLGKLLLICLFQAVLAETLVSITDGPKFVNPFFQKI
jgi:hypothetical protein